MTRTSTLLSSAPGRGDGQSCLRAFIACENGATAIEYALMATIFSVTVIGASSSIRSAIQSALTTVTTAIVAANNS
jgi:Flp pilus assembly pilin Flp